MVHSTRKTRQKPTRLVIILLAVLLLAGGLWWYFSRPVRKTNVTIPSTNSSQKPSAVNQHSTNSGSSSNSSTTPSSTKSNTNSPAEATNLNLLAPFGTFISNHHPGQNGAPTTEQSVCNTTPGASCYIRFTNGSLVRTLTAQTTDSNGATIWNWDVKAAGFAEGSWQVTAFASLNGQTKTTSDSQALVIQ